MSTDHEIPTPQPGAELAQSLAIQALRRGEYPEPDGPEFLAEKFLEQFIFTDQKPPAWAQRELALRWRVLSHRWKKKVLH